MVAVYPVCKAENLTDRTANEETDIRQRVHLWVVELERAHDPVRPGDDHGNDNLS
jgi:hypothetical protein